MRTTISPLRKVHCTAQRVDFLDVGRDRHQFGFGQCLQFARLRGDALDGVRHLAAEHPGDRKEGRADRDREDQTIELEPADVLNEVVLCSQQQDAAILTFAQRKLHHPEQEAFPGSVLDVSFVAVLVVRTANDRGHDARIDLIDRG